MKAQTYGRVRYQPAANGNRPLWVIEAPPHVRQRLKRIFPRVEAWKTGALAMTDTPEIARELTWVLDRWPMNMAARARERLERRTDEYNEGQATVQRILAGHHTPAELKTPARAPRDYQQVAADLAIATGRLLLVDELGLGKSMTSLLVLAAADALPALVVCPTHLPPQWLGELLATWPWLRGHIIRSTKVYDPAKRRESKGHDPDVLFMSYAKLAGWSDHLAGQVRTVIFDEAQELRRPVSQKYEAAAQVAHAATYRLGLTATPVYNYGGEIHSVLSVLDPDALGDQSEFAVEWGAGYWDQKLSVRDPEALGEYLRESGLMLRRTRKDVGRELPEVTKVPHAVDTDEATLDRLTGDALDLAQLIVSRSGTRQELWTASGEFDWKMRQATGIAKARYVAEFVRLLLDSEAKLVLFGWHRAVYDIWAKELADFYPAFYTGEESTAQKQRSEAAFLRGASRVLVMSLRAGSGLDGLQDAAHVAVFGELDWSPGMHDQCIGRLHRDGQDEPVVAYFLVAEHGADPVMAEVLNLKRMQSDPMIRPDGNLFKDAPNAQDRVRRLAEDMLAKRRHRRG